MADNPQETPQPEQPPADQPQEKPKIIVDDDWKAQAQAEKQKLDEEIKAKQEAGEAAPGAPGAEGQPRRLPPASFGTLVNSLGTQALLALGGYEDRKTKRRLVDMDLAKHQIDTLAMLEEKTKGNLTDEEKQLLDGVLYQARMQFVEFAQRISQVAPPGADQAVP